jgi:hypothetical protein
LAKDCALSALVLAHVPCVVRSGVEVFSDCFKSFCSFPQGVISGGRGGKTVEEHLEVVILVFMKELSKLLRSPVE